MTIHDDTLVLDTHIDIRWPETPDWTGETRQLVDLPKMRAGGMSAAIFIAYVGQGRRDPAGHAAAGARAEAMLRHIAARAAISGTRFCATPDALEACFVAGDTAVLSAVENGYAMGHDLGRIGLWRSLGAVYLTLTHDGHNDLSDSARPRAALGDAPAEHGGLSKLGEAAIAEMNARGLMELIILNIGLERGLITPTLFSILVFMAIVTTLMATPLFNWVQRMPAGQARVDADGG